MTDLLNLIQTARQGIDRLPQRRHLKPENIERWLTAMATREPDRLLWHVTRLSGIGGSEVGRLVANRRNETSNFGSARRLVMEKLMIVLPDPPTPYMSRGIETEDLHRAKFLRDWSAVRDVAAIETLTKARGPLPFMRYSPDDVILLPQDDNRRILLDYKSPTSANEEDLIGFEYECQLNYGDLIGRHAGLHFDNGLLSRLNWADWTCTCNWVDLSDTLQEEITEAAHHYWTNCVLTGDLPPLPAPPEAKFTTPPEVIQRLTSVSAQIVALDQTAKCMLDEVDVLKKELAVVTAAGDVGAKATIFAHDFTVGEKLVEDRLRDALIAAGLDVDAELERLSVATAWDVDAMVAALTQDGAEVAGFVKARAIDIAAVKARLAELDIQPTVVFDYPVACKKKGNTKKHPEPHAVKEHFAVVGAGVKGQVLATVAEMTQPKPEIADDEPIVDMEMDDAPEAMVVG